ncbi:MAG: UDP-N-acetylmuramoyl-L-alanyl-D-glutamate-2,6-diaminopimelate ligase [Parcubacteria group bacterium GW2011_GWA2_43_13]|nr:MAG: UDP-N-acetylmuramoyl-L-alanyl-D-glutamate-2,6-diaminopimelate ligase [Parcubacteria group bacterium GW2011_GWA2_43_13]
MIGVTGTNGKTTTCHMIADMIEHAGVKVGLTSTIEFRIADTRWVNDTKQGMQGRFRLQKLLRRMVKAGCRVAVIETTSEGISQYRHWGIEYSIGVLTNLTPEHIESHGSFEQYKKAKGMLFFTLKRKKKKQFEDVIPTSIINTDSPHADYFLSIPVERRWCYGLKGGHCFATEDQCEKKCTAEITEMHFHGIECVLNGMPVNLALSGRMNVYNALAAWCVGEALDISVEDRKKALEKMTRVAGRMEKIEHNGITVVVDYAHDPAALEQVYETLSAIKVPSARLIGVFGATGGGRDHSKRPVMGKLAAAYCDAIVICNDDPYDEDPQSIMSAIESGVKEKGRHVKDETYWIIEDRRKAIKKAIEFARSGDIIALTGKGAEECIVLADGKQKWNDKNVVEELFLLCG